MARENISTKKAMQAYDSGAKAALHGWSEESNPYTTGHIRL